MNLGVLFGDAYLIVIELSVAIILSFLFNVIANRTNIPSVLMLILAGIVIKYALSSDIDVGEQLLETPILEIVGIIGLIMIVLEAALDLELTWEKWPILWKSFSIALIGLVGSTFVCAYILLYFYPDMGLLKALLYATPLSILSSAIIIPSVGNLVQQKKEFHIYESTFSDILGIMQFYFIEGLMAPEATGGGAALSFLGNFALTLLISLLASYLLIFLFQNLTAHVKLFLLIAILLLLYSVGKKLHLSSLIIILVFGLIMSNHHIFFRGRLRKWLKTETLKQIIVEFHVLTIETAFVVRTFFFIIFGITISLTQLADTRVWLISAAILVSIYGLRWILLRLFYQRDISPQLYIVPRGLVTVLLFYSIPSEMQYEAFNPGILLFIIIATNIVMTISLIVDRRGRSVKQLPVPDDKLVIPAEKIYQGFQSKLLKEKYGQK